MAHSIRNLQLWQLLAFGTHTHTHTHTHTQFSTLSLGIQALCCNYHCTICTTLTIPTTAQPVLTLVFMAHTPTMTVCTMGRVDGGFSSEEWPGSGSISPHVQQTIGRIHRYSFCTTPLTGILKLCAIKQLGSVHTTHRLHYSTVQRRDTQLTLKLAKSRRALCRHGNVITAMRLHVCTRQMYMQCSELQIRRSLEIGNQGRIREREGEGEGGRKQLGERMKEGGREGDGGICTTSCIIHVYTSKLTSSSV